MRPRRAICVRTINCFGVGESDLEAMLPDMIRRGRQPTVGITVSKATISHHLKELANAGLVEPEKDGQYMHYTVNAEALKAYSEELMRRIVTPPIV